MFRLLSLLFMFFIFSAFASDNIYKKFLDEKEPNVLFESCVNLITGNLIIEDNIDDKDAIDLNKRYTSLNNFDLLKREEKEHLEFILAGFSYVGISRAFFYGDRVEILEKTGEILSFGAPYTNNKKRKAKDEIKILNYKDSKYLAKFFHHKDIKAQDPNKIKVEMRGLFDLYVLYPNGEEKHFKRKNVHSNEYFLTSQKLLNQKVINYFYDEFNNLSEIRELNSAMDKTYFWVKFHHLHPEKKYNDKSKDKHDVKIETSDGKNYELKFKDYYPLISNKDKAKHPFYIIDKIISDRDQNFTYHLGYKQTHPLLKTAYLFDMEIEIDYYLLGNKNPETDVVFYDYTDPRFERVKTVTEKNQLGVSKESYKFYYDVGVFNQTAGITRIEDSKNREYVYFYNKDFKIEKIQRFGSCNSEKKLLNEEIFVWEKKNSSIFLASKEFLDQDQNTVIEVKYFYDENNNLIEEKYRVDISKRPDSKSPDSKSRNFENFSKSYKYSEDDKNLVIEKTDENDLKTTYCYLPNTNLLSSKFISSKSEIKKRVFYEYNDQFQLIKKVLDDGTSFDINDLKNITFRKIKYIYPNHEEPFYGKKSSIEEKFLDLDSLEEKLFRRKQYNYLDDKIIKTDIFDSSNQYVYSYVDEDSLKLIKEQNSYDLMKPFQTENKDVLTVDYNIFSSPTYIKYQDGSEIRFTYNFDGTIKSFIDQNQTKYHFEYDYLKRLNYKKVINSRGHILDEQKYKYDFFTLLEKQDLYQTTTYSYDYCKRLIKEEKILNSEIFDIKYFYDDLSRRYKTIYNSELIITSQLNILNQKLFETVDLKGVTIYKKSFFAENIQSNYLQAKPVKLFDIFQNIREKIFYEFDLKELKYNFEYLSVYDLKFTNYAFSNFLIRNPLNNIFISYDQKKPIFINEDIKNPCVSSIELFLDNSLDLKSIFLDNLFDFNKRKIKVFISTQALTSMRDNDLKIEEILESLKMPSDIKQLNEREFVISYNNLKSLIDLSEKDSFYIENILVHK